MSLISIPAFGVFSQLKRLGLLNFKRSSYICLGINAVVLSTL